MSPKTLFCAGLVAASVWITGCERQASFADDIQPILTDSCVRCHDGNAEGEAVSGLNLTSYEGVMQGTRFGKVVVPGSAMSSALYLTVSGKTGPEIRMPPHHEGKWAQGEGIPLSARYIDTIERWIDQGAKNN